MANRAQPSGAASPRKPRQRASKEARGVQQSKKRRGVSVPATNSTRSQRPPGSRASASSGAGGSRSNRSSGRPTAYDRGRRGDRAAKDVGKETRADRRLTKEYPSARKGERERRDFGEGGDRRSGGGRHSTSTPRDRAGKPSFRRPQHEQRAERGHGGRERDETTSVRGSLPSRRSRQPRDSSRPSRRATTGRGAATERGRADWGSVARRGAFRLVEGPPEAQRRARPAPRCDSGDRDRPAEPQRASARYRVLGSHDRTWARPEERQARRTSPGRRSGAPRGKRAPTDIRGEIATSESRRLRAQIERRVTEAAAAYERDRYQDALRILRSLPTDTANVAAVRELRGLTFYRLGRWNEALRELRAFSELTGSVDQHPVIADAERALGHHDRVAEIWSEIRRSGTSSDVLAEGRIVMAGSLADRGLVKEAIALLGPATLRKVTKPHERHIRQWYLLGDLYERTGDVPRAREMFQRVVDADPETSDAVERLSALSAPSRRRATKQRR